MTWTIARGLQTEMETLVSLSAFGSAIKRNKISGHQQRWPRPLPGAILIPPALLVVADWLKPTQYDLEAYSPLPLIPYHKLGLRPNCERSELSSALLFFSEVLSITNCRISRMGIIVGWTGGI